MYVGEEQWGKRDGKKETEWARMNRMNISLKWSSLNWNGGKICFELWSWQSFTRAKRYAIEVKVKVENQSDREWKYVSIISAEREREREGGRGRESAYTKNQRSNFYGDLQQWILKYLLRLCSFKQWRVQSAKCERCYSIVCCYFSMLSVFRTI